MRVALVRHFPVSEPLPRGWVTGAELEIWRQRYDAAEVRATAVEDESSRWTHCYANNLQRAQTTARAMYSGDIITHSGLREAQFTPFSTGALRLPVWLWRMMFRLAWLTGHASQRPYRDDFLNRVRTMAEVIDSHEKDVLVVCHAGMMFYLRKELLRRGFCGPKFGMAEHARLYVFERR